MEDTLGVNECVVYNKVAEGLNPCFNGRYSRSYAGIALVNSQIVLILVLMEDTLGE